MRTKHTKDLAVGALEGEERGIPSVNESASSPTKKFLIAAALILPTSAAVGFGYLKFHDKEAKAAQVETKQSETLKSAAPARTFTVPPPLPSPAMAQVTPTVPSVPEMAPPLPGSAGNSDGSSMPLDKAASSLMVTNERQDQSSGIADPSQAGSLGSQTLGAGGALSQGGEGTSETLAASATPMRKASMIGNQNFILAKGGFIDCALQTRLDSTIPGMTACVVTRNIFSDNGKVLLIERGSTASGEYKSNIKQGQARIGVVWTRIKTPSGVIINLDSGGTDQLGGAGVPGYVDNHFWERFGGAILVSMIDDVARAITSNTGATNGNQINFNGTTDAAANMGVEVLRNTINIPPTLYKNQGEAVGIYVARDLDFSSVYDVEAE